MTQDVRLGLACALGCYTIWGLLPLYFRALAAYPPDIILAHRVFWSVPTGLAFLAAFGLFAKFREALRWPTLRWLLVSGLLIGVNWWVYIWAVGQNRVVEASVGYYINPLVNVAIGAMFLRERLRGAQWVAVALASLGVAGEALALGRMPWVALILCATFAVYGVIRKRVAVDGRVGFCVEVLILLPLLGLWLGLHGLKPDLLATSATDWGLLIASGLITATPLILFAMAARRLRLSTIGFIQFLGPTLQFLLGMSFGEPVSPQRLMGFGLIWLAVAIFSVDSMRHELQQRQRARALA